MKSLQFKKSPNLAFYFFLTFLCFYFSAHSQNYGVTDKITIIKMFYGQQPSASAVLTITEPCGYPKTEGCGKPIKAQYNFDPNRQYNSGTTFMTHDNYTILLRANGSTTQVSPNSSNRIKVKDGNEVHSPKGIVGVVADKARDIRKSIIIEGNNVSAKMKTTEFWVDTRGGQTKFSPVEGTITILEKVPVTVGNQVFKDQTEDRERARDATYPLRTERSGGDAAYLTGQQSAKNYDSVNDAIYNINNYINQNSDYMYPEELADTYILLGELYLNNKDYRNAKICFNNSAEIYTYIDPTGLYALEAELYLAEAQIYSNDADGYTAVKTTIDELIDQYYYYYEEYVYAGEIQEYDIQTSYCYDLVDTLDLLGWAYDLINNETEADRYYNAAANYPCQN